MIVDDELNLTQALDPGDDASMQVAFGLSIVTQFARGHDPSAVIEELVQNEYDAEGNDLRVLFRGDSLIVTGNGRTIDDKGWTRLSVLLGTGEVAGSRGRVIEPKRNGIGSKNFGLRSLFLYGNPIIVASGGRLNKLDLRHGSLPNPVSHAQSQMRKGVIIQVPYRQEAVDGLEPFDEPRERDALHRIAQELPYLLIKLALPNNRRSLSRVRITSERVNRQLSWKQTVRQLPTKAKQTVVLQRTIETRDSEGATSKRTRIEELEFQRGLSIPPELRAQEFADYDSIGTEPS